MSAMASQITSPAIVYSSNYSGAKKTSKPRITGLCEGNSPVTGEFPPQGDSNAENVSIWWRHHVSCNVLSYFTIAVFECMCACDLCILFMLPLEIHEANVICWPVNLINLIASHLISISISISSYLISYYLPPAKWGPFSPASLW